MNRIIVSLVIVACLIGSATAANSYAYYQNLDMSQVSVVAGGGSGFLFIPPSIVPNSDVSGNNMSLSGAYMQFPSGGSWPYYVIAYIPTKERFAQLLALKSNGGSISWLTIQGGNPSQGMTDLVGTTWYVMVVQQK